MSYSSQESDNIIFQNVIRECEETFNPDDPRHFIDMYLKEREIQKHNPIYQYRCKDSKHIYVQYYNSYRVSLPVIYF